MFHVHDSQEVFLNEKWNSPNIPVHVARIPYIQLHSFYYEVPEDISRPTNGLATTRRSVEALGRPFEADADLRPPNASYGTLLDPYIGKAFN